MGATVLVKQMDLQFTAVMTAINAFRAEMWSEFSSMRSANQLEAARWVSPPAER